MSSEAKEQSGDSNRQPEEGLELAEIVVPSATLGSSVDPPVALDAVAHAQATGPTHVIPVQPQAKGDVQVVNTEDKSPVAIGADPADMYLSTASVVSPTATVSTFSWHHIHYALPVPQKTKAKKKEQAPPAEMKQLLQDLNGDISAGEVVAIMGGSGAGKTTLLNTLAGRIGPAGMLTGDILVDGAPRRHAIWRNQCAYVEQDDLLYPNLSVYETIKFAALLRLPSSMSTEIKLQRVDEVIMELGLNGCRHTRIGGPTQRGISGGERKRVSIAIELVAQPSILFLDEPTSGLDAFTAVNIIDTIKKLAVSQKKIVLMTIHQPRTDILEMFDKIALLSVGRIAFFGPLEEALTHFAALGFPLPPKTNPSDFFMDIGTLDQRSETLREKSMQRIKLFHDAWGANKKAAAGTSEVAISKTKTTIAGSGHPREASQWPSTWLHEFTTLLQRNMLDVSRDFRATVAFLAQGLVLLFLIGFTFFRFSMDQASIQNRLGLLFFLCINTAFGVIMPLVTSLPMQKIIVRHERASGAYRPSSAYLARYLASLPVTFLGNTILVVPIYFMAGLQLDAAHFFSYWCILFVHFNTAIAYAFLIGSLVPSVEVAQIITPLTLSVQLLFGGQFLNLETITWALKWIQYVAFISYSNKALAQNEFNGLTFECAPNSQCTPTGEMVLSNNFLDSVPKWWCVGINLFILAFCLIGGFFAFKRATKPVLRLI